MRKFIRLFFTSD